MHGWPKAVLALVLGMSVMPSVSARPEYDRVTKVATVSDVTTDGVLWTPATGYIAYIESCVVSSGGAQQTLLEMSDVAILPRIYTAADTTEQYWVNKTGTKDQTVTYTTSSSTTTTIVCNGYEFPG